MENVRLGIQMEGFQELREQSSGLGMDEPEKSQTNEQKQQAFDDLETCDEDHARVVLFRHRVFVQGNLVCRAILHVKEKNNTFLVSLRNPSFRVFVGLVTYDLTLICGSIPTVMLYRSHG